MVGVYESPHGIRKDLSLEAGQPVTLQSVKAVPSARSGDSVTLIAARGTLQIKATGRLMDDAQVCGDVKVTVYLLGDCRPYHAPGLFDKQLGCSAGCTTLTPAEDAWISRAGSYKIEKCEGEL